MPIYRIYNGGEITSLACGYRSVIGLPPGRKWIVLCDWTTLETAKVSLDAWRKLRPQEVDYSVRKVQAHMKHMTKYVTPTAAVKEALQHVAAMRSRPR